MREPKVCLIAIIATLLCGGWAAEARAEPISIGVFQWTFDADFNPTLGVDIFPDFPDFPGWPTDLALDGVFAEFTLSDSSVGQAFFGGYASDSASSCTGQTVSLDSSSGSLQVPGLADTGCFPSLPLPSSDIVQASLVFSFDPAIGSVTVGALGGPADETSVQPIFFERASATTAVPEPATIALLAVALAGLARLCRIRTRT
jgi:hypothetical protein